MNAVKGKVKYAMQVKAVQKPPIPGLCRLHMIKMNPETNKPETETNSLRQRLFS
jgi:hypothetical protein